MRTHRQFNKIAVGCVSANAQRQTTPIRRATPPGENLSMNPRRQRCQGRSCARVALNVGIEAGIHNFRLISYRLFICRPSYPMGISNSLCWAGNPGLLHLCKMRTPRGLQRRFVPKPRSVLRLHGLQRLQQLLLDFHNLLKSHLRGLGRVGALQTFQLAL
jgi:hypothetical protein